MRLSLSGETGFTVVATMLAVVVLGAGFVAGRFYKAPQLRTVRHVVTRSPYGKPDRSIDGAQVNAQLAGFTCDVYQRSQTVICHP